ncbi:MAG TPA: hypothetical protein PK431_00805 [Chitinophagales bacterium]|mgnify:FL=1|nr:hypothetical protein [Chitinophagales bacterium]
MMRPTINIYTDGSCHTQQQIGAWSAIILVDDEKIILSGIEINTTHQRMELLAVINAIEYIQVHFKTSKQIQLNSDSQYVIGLITRAEKLAAKNYQTKKGNEIANDDLVKKWLFLNSIFSIECNKIKAHQPLSATTKYNIEVDKLSRKLVRDEIRKLK